MKIVNADDLDDTKKDYPSNPQMVNSSDVKSNSTAIMADEPEKSVDNDLTTIQS